MKHGSGPMQRQSAFAACGSTKALLELTATWICNGQPEQVIHGTSSNFGQIELLHAFVIMIYII